MMGPDFADVVLAVVPMLLLVGAWIFFMRRMKDDGGGYAQLQRRKVEALERIAAALEKRQ